jgi:putative permease
MFEVFRNWFRRAFADPQAAMLAVVLLLGFFVVVYMGEMLAPVLAALVFAYLLEGLTELLVRRHVPRLLAVWLVFLVFLVSLLLILFGLIPLLSQEISHLVQE